MFTGLTLDTLGIMFSPLPTLPADLFDLQPGLRGINLQQNDFVTLPDTIFSSLTGLNYIHLYYNRLKDLPTIPPLQYANNASVEQNCLSIRDSSPATIAYMEARYGTGWEGSQILCAVLDYDPPQPPSGEEAGPVEASISFYGPERKEAAFTGANSGLDLSYTFYVNGDYLFDFSGSTHQ